MHVLMGKVSHERQANESFLGHGEFSDLEAHLCDEACANLPMLLAKPFNFGQYALLAYPIFLHCQLCGNQGILS